MEKEITTAGIYKILLLEPEKTHDWSFLQPYTEILLSQFYQGVTIDLPITQETVNFENESSDDDDGLFSEINVSGSIRKNQSTHINTIRKIYGNRKIVELFFINGKKYLVGSKKSPATITFTEKNSGVTKKEITFSIKCKSLHGPIIDVS